MYLQPEVADIIDVLSKKYKLPKKKIEQIVQSQFEFVQEQIAVGELGKPDTFISIGLGCLGTFYPNTKMMYTVEKNKQKKKEGKEWQENKTKD